MWLALLIVILLFCRKISWEDHYAQVRGGKCYRTLHKFQHYLWCYSGKLFLSINCYLLLLYNSKCSLFCTIGFYGLNDSATPSLVLGSKRLLILVCVSICVCMHHRELSECAFIVVYPSQMFIYRTHDRQSCCLHIIQLNTFCFVPIFRNGKMQCTNWLMIRLISS